MYVDIEGKKLVALTLDLKKARNGTSHLSRAIFSLFFGPWYWKDIWWLILKKPHRCTLSSWTLSGLNLRDDMISESLLFLFEGGASHEHLANNPTYPAKSRMGMQILPLSLIDGSLHTLNLRFKSSQYSVWKLSIVKLWR